MKIGEDEKSKLLRYLVDHWQTDEVELVRDINTELSGFELETLKREAKSLPADKLKDRLQDDDVRLGVAAVLLGYQGDKSVVPVLRSRLTKRPPPKIDLSVTTNLQVGYVLVSPSEGWNHLNKIVNDSASDFHDRLAALKSISMIYHNKLASIAEDDVLKAMSALIGQADVADLAIDNLRKASCWRLTDAILALQGKKGFDQPLIRRSMLRYCLVCPDEKAKAFVDQTRKANPELVSEVDTLLKAEAFTNSLHAK